jgi:hypothetical protein
MAIFPQAAAGGWAWLRLEVAQAACYRKEILAD